MSQQAPPRLRLQYASDIHLEHMSDAQVDQLIASVQRLAPLLILAGDVGDPFRDSYAQFVGAMAERFDWVLVVAGNHEFYGHAIGETIARINQVCGLHANVVFLNDQAWELPDIAPTSSRRLPPVRFFGGTMWSSVKEAERSEVEALLNDFACIAGFGLKEYDNRHWVFVDLLTAELQRPEPALVAAQKEIRVVITHYLPSYRLIDPAYRNSRVNSAFASELEAADDPRIVAWFYGHTHKGRAGPRFFCNPIGYRGENVAPSLNHVAEITVA